MLFLLAALAIGAMALAHTAPFPFLLDYLAPGRSIWRMPHEAHPPTVYLTFDDGPNPRATGALLDVLKKEDAPATFFLIDRHLTEETAPLVRRMFDEGHAVALHSHTRALMLLSPEQLAATLTAAADRIERLAGRRPCRAFRPHAGWRSGQMYAGLARIDHALVGWAWGAWDWNWFRRRSGESVARRVLEHVSPGDIIVLHDGHHINPTPNRDYTIDATTRLVPALRARGFRLGTVC